MPRVCALQGTRGGGGGGEAHLNSGSNAAAVAAAALRDGTLPPESRSAASSAFTCAFTVSSCDCSRAASAASAAVVAAGGGTSAYRLAIRALSSGARCACSRRTQPQRASRLCNLNGTLQMLPTDPFPLLTQAKSSSRLCACHCRFAQRHTLRP
jgi:hypothetical protein